jgi:maleylpyruvate isomerase
VTDFDAATTLADINAATEHLLESVADLTDDDIRASSLCSGWTRGHVLTHLARNADGLSNMLNTASTGEVTPMYESDEKRDADIEAGAGRPADEIRADLLESANRFTAAFEAVGPGQWATPVYRTPGVTNIEADQVGGKRLGEVLIHHVDLGLDFTPAHWSDAFTDAQFIDTLVRFTGRAGFPALRLDVEEEDAWYGVNAHADDEAVVAIHGPKRALLAWLMGRASGDGLVTTLPEGGRGQLPEIPAWG